MSFATDGGVVAADGGVEALDVSLNEVGKVGIFLQVNSVALQVCEHGLAGGGELEGLLLPFLVAADVLELDVEGAEPFCDVLEVRQAAEGARRVVEVLVDVGAGLLDAEVLVEDGVEGVACGGVEVGPVADLARGVNQGSVTLDLVGMELAGFREGHVLVPLVAEAAVARVGLFGFVQGRRA